MTWHAQLQLVMTNLKALSGLQDVVSFIEAKGMLKAALA
jgi:hypothetical protein